jgi:hypothetical protein
MAIIRESTGLRNERLESGGSSLADALANGIIRIYSGTMPASADSAITGTLLCEITESGGSFSSGTATNGINLDVAASGTVSKDATETWQGDNVAGGVATYGVYYANTVDATASTTAIRVVFDVSTSGAFLNLSTTTLVSGETTVLSSFSFTQPE